MPRKLVIALCALFVLFAFTACPQTSVIPFPLPDPTPDVPTPGPEPTPDPEPLPDPDDPGVYYVNDQASFLKAIEDAASDEVDSTIVLSDSFEYNNSQYISNAENLTIRSANENVVISLKSGMVFQQSTNVVIDGVHFDSYVYNALEIHNQGEADITIKNSYIKSADSATALIGVALDAELAGKVILDNNQFEGFITAIYVNNTTADVTIKNNTIIDKGGIILDWKLANDATAADIQIPAANIAGNIGPEDTSSTDNTLRFTVAYAAGISDDLVKYYDDLKANNTSMRTLAILQNGQIVYPYIEVKNEAELVAAMTSAHANPIEIRVANGTSISGGDAAHEGGLSIDGAHDVKVVTEEGAKITFNAPIVLNNADNVTFDITAETAQDAKAISVQSTTGDTGVIIENSHFTAANRADNDIAIATSPGTTTILKVTNTEFTDYITAIYLGSTGKTEITGNRINTYGGIYIEPTVSNDASEAVFPNITITGNTINAESESTDNSIRFGINGVNVDALGTEVAKFANALMNNNTADIYVLNSSVAPIWKNGEMIKE